MSIPGIPDARGTELPVGPIDQQLFFLDVPNNSDPPRGWYISMVGLAGGTDWTYLGRALTDRGDLVRPIEPLHKHE